MIGLLQTCSIMLMWLFAQILLKTETSYSIFFLNFDLVKWSMHIYIILYCFAVCCFLFFVLRPWFYYLTVPFCFQYFAWCA